MSGKRSRKDKRKTRKERQKKGEAKEGIEEERTRSSEQRRIKVNQRRERRGEERKGKEGLSHMFPWDSGHQEISPSLSQVPLNRSSFCQTMAHSPYSFLFQAVTIDSSTGFYLGKGPITIS